MSGGATGSFDVRCDKEVSRVLSSDFWISESKRCLYQAVKELPYTVVEGEVAL